MLGEENRCRYGVDNDTLMTINAHYPPNLFPGVWQRLESLCEAGRLHICEEVAREYSPKSPTAVSKWIGDHPSVVVGLDRFQHCFAALMADAPSRGLELVDEERSDGREVADPYVVALGLMLDGRLPEGLDVPSDGPQQGMVVTEEKPSPAKRPSKIPDVCLAYNLGRTNWLGLLEREAYTDLPL